MARKSFGENVTAKPMPKESRVRQKENGLPWIGLKEQPVQRVYGGAEGSSRLAPVWSEVGSTGQGDLEMEGTQGPDGH